MEDQEPRRDEQHCGDLVQYSNPGELRASEDVGNRKTLFPLSMRPKLRKGDMRLTYKTLRTCPLGENIQANNGAENSQRTAENSGTRRGEIANTKQFWMGSYLLWIFLIELIIMMQLACFYESFNFLVKVKWECVTHIYIPDCTFADIFRGS